MERELGPSEFILTARQGRQMDDIQQPPNVAAAAKAGAGAFASIMEIDNFIDPADTRRWIVRGLKMHKTRAVEGKSCSFVDNW